MDYLQFTGPLILFVGLITSNHRQIGVNIVGLLNRFETSSVKCWTTNFSIHASECPVFIMNQLKSVYNIPFLDSYSHTMHTCLSIFTDVFLSLTCVQWC